MKQKLLLVTVIAIAFAYIESSVVTYLRALLYPEGFHFPLEDVPSLLVFIELGRELATVALLVGLAFLAGHARSQRDAYLVLAVGVWDIFYYIWLKIFIDWPESLFTWDVLFLIPFPWTNPVISPVLVSMALISAALIILFMEQHFKESFHLNRWEWFGELIAASLILWSYFWNAKHIGVSEDLLDYPYLLLISGLLLGITIFAVHIQKQYLKGNPP